MTPEPIAPEELELARIWPERFAPKFIRCQHPRTPENIYVFTRHTTGKPYDVCKTCRRASYNQKYKAKQIRLAKKDPQPIIRLVPKLAPPPPVRADAPLVFRTQCKAHSGENGLRCKLLAHSTGKHRNERGEFSIVLLPGQTPGRVLELAWIARAGSGL